MINMKRYNGIILAVLLTITGILALVIINMLQDTITSFPGDRLTANPVVRLNPNSALKPAQIRIYSPQNPDIAASPQIDVLIPDVKYLATSSGYTLYDPTSAGMQSFLTSDITDRNLYDIDSYTCWNYAADVIDNATEKHIRCGFVYIEFTSSAHACIVFDTTDKGLVFIDPQTDSIVELAVGTHYYQSIMPAPGYYYTQPSYDDTVKTFAIIW